MTAKRTLRLGTRGSQLALAQSQLVADEITEKTGFPVSLVTIVTRGDRVTDRPLQEVGGKGLFTQELEAALLDGSVDFAVHSMKDMPTEMPPGLAFGAVPEREDPRDVLVGARLEDLASGAVVGTGSVRRRMQLLALRPDLEVRGIRGNVDTRIAKQRRGEYDAIVLAAAGLRRLGREAEATEFFTADAMVPAVGQGALALQCRSKDPVVGPVLESIHHQDTALCVAAERAFLAAVSGGCSAPAACHAHREGHEVVVTGVLEHEGGLRRLTLRTDPLHVGVCGKELARRLRT